METIDDIIEELFATATAPLPASTVNAIHGCRTGHPLARGKSDAERARDLWFATSRPGFHADALLKVYRLLPKEDKAA